MKIKHHWFLHLAIFWVAVIGTTAKAGIVPPEIAGQVAFNKYLQSIPLNLRNQAEGLTAELVFVQVEKGDTLFYVFNIQNRTCFVIVSAESNAVPVLAYSYNNTFDPGHIPPAVSLWFSHLAEQIRYIRTAEAAGGSWVETLWQLALAPPPPPMNTQVVLPLTSKWGQGCYYNHFCPPDGNGPCGKTLVGCGATAMGQIMKYHQFPVQGFSSHYYTHSTHGLQGANFSSATYDWAMMPDNLQNSNAEVAGLLYHCGVAQDMDYGTSISISQKIFLWQAFIDYFKYSNNAKLIDRNDVLFNWADTLRWQIAQGFPLIHTATDPVYGGHGFVCHGYDTVDYFLFNWGWDGSGDGFYYINGLNPSIQNPANQSTTNFNFSAYHSAIIHLYPAILPTVSSISVSSITNSTASFSGNVSFTGGQNVYSRGVCWSTSPNPVITNAHSACGQGSGSFSCTMTGLLPGTVYHARSFATNSIGTAYGSNITFVTPSGPATSVTGVAVAPKTLALSVIGAPVTLSAQVFPVNAINQAVTWSSLHTAIATVGPSGIVTPISPGLAKIVVHTVEGNFADTCTITVGLNPVSPGNIVSKIEYYFDTDPGTGYRYLLPVSPSSAMDISASIDVGQLNDGMHTLYIIAFDSSGNESFTHYTTFYKNILGSTDTAKITQIEYYFNTDPGPGNRPTIPVAPSANVDLHHLIDVSSLPDGQHLLYVIARADNQTRSFTRYFTFYKNVFGGNDTALITQIEYFLDNDPGEGNGTQVAFTPGYTVDLNFIADVSGITPGPHTFFIRSKNEQGVWSFKHKHIINQDTSSLVLVNQMGFSSSNLQAGTSYPFSATIKNTGASTWTGCFYLKQGSPNWIVFGNKSIAAGATLTITGNYTPTQPGVSVPVTLCHQKNCTGNSLPVYAGSYLNPILVNIINHTPSCAFLDCSSPTNCGNTTYQSTTHTAVQYLCARNIVSTMNNNVSPNADITRAQLAKIALYGLFGDSLNVPNPLVSDYFPSPYADLQNQNTYYYRAAKALLYLDFGDGVTPFDRDRMWFNPSGTISRQLVLKVLFEAFNIQPNTNGTNPFNDFGQNDPFYGYAKRAYDLGITTSSVLPYDFRPMDQCTRAEAFIFLYRIMTHSPSLMPAVNNSLDPFYSSFFIPGNSKLATLSSAKGIESGNFNHYTKSCFSIPGYSLPLNFDFGYQSYMTEIPGDICVVNPLGVAWSHSYNIYLNVIADPGSTDSLFLVHLNDGSILIYSFDATGNQYVSQTYGNYQVLEKISSTQFQLKAKNQVRHIFSRFASNDVAYYLTSIVDRNGITLTISYVQGVNYTVPGTNLTKGTRRIDFVKDHSGRKLQFGYLFGTNLIKTVTDPLGRTITFNYINEQLRTYTDAKGQSTHYQYGALKTESNLLKNIQLPKGNVINNQYQQRKLVSSQFNNNNLTTIAHQPNYVAGNADFYKSTVAVPQQGGQAIITNYQHDRNGSITSVSGNPAISMSAQYNDPLHPSLPNSITNHKSNITIAPLYDSVGNVTKITTTGGTISFSETFQYNALNDLTHYTDGNNNTTQYFYQNGNLVKVKDALNQETNITNNNDGQPVSITNPSGITMTFGYNSFGNQDQIKFPALGLTATMVYDLAGRMTGATNFNGQTMHYAYDLNDNVITETDPLSNQTTYLYDVNDNLTSITNAKGFPTLYVYDSITDWLISESFQGYVKLYQYNDDGTLKSYTNANGNTLNYTYDNAGRILNDGYATYSYLPNGNLYSITKDGKSVVFTYDGISRIISVSYNGKTVGYTYDNAGNMLTMVYPGNKTVTYTYDATHKLKTVKDWNNNLTTYHYRADGQLDNMIYPNGVKTSYTYDNAGRFTGLSSRRNFGTGSIIAEYAFTLDPLGNHLQESINEPFSGYLPIPAQTIQYTYNNANRILAAGSMNFGFDNNGNTISKNGNNYSYDPLNNLTSVSGAFNATYQYDGAGNRRVAARNGIITHYVLDILGIGNVLMETDASGTPQNYYVYGLGLISRIKPNNTTSYYIYDFRGSTVAMVDATSNATVTHNYQYDDFGNVLQIQEADANIFRYVGKYGVMYEDSSLVFMRARYYDPTIGRFLSEDPVWSTNLYPYADNNPINLIDVNGMASGGCVKFVSGYLGLNSYGKGNGNAHQYDDENGYLIRNGWKKVTNLGYSSQYIEKGQSIIVFNLDFYKQSDSELLRKNGHIGVIYDYKFGKNKQNVNGIFIRLLHNTADGQKSNHESGGYLNNEYKFYSFDLIDKGIVSLWNPPLRICKDTPRKKTKKKKELLKESFYGIYF